jgi:hypothetical protein
MRALAFFHTSSFPKPKLKRWNAWSAAAAGFAIDNSVDLPVSVQRRDGTLQ